MVCLNQVYYKIIIYKENKHYKLIKLETIYKSEEAWVCLDRESLTQRSASALI
jgi:hypothetical protein